MTGPIHGVRSRKNMTYQIPALQTFSFKSEEWPTWHRRFERFCQATGLTEKSEETQINTLIYSMGDKAEDLLQTFSLSQEDAKKYSKVIEKFDSHSIQRRNVIYRCGCMDVCMLCFV